MSHKILKGWGYWDTTNYPLGGCFRRATEDIPCRPLRDAPVKTNHGYLCEFETEDGRKVWASEQAFSPA